MSDKTRHALELCAQTAAAAYDALQAVDEPASSKDAEILRKDFLSILTLLYAAATKIALSLKPPNPDYQASLRPITDMGGASVALSACASQFTTHQHGPAMRRKVRSLAGNVLHAARHLCSSLASDSGDIYVLTGAVHDSVDRARELPESELATIRAIFRTNQACLDDGLPELKELIEGSEDPDDGWNDLEDELGDDLTSKTLSVEERARVSTLFPLIKITTQLHKKILSDCLAVSLEPPLPLPRLAALEPLSTQLLTHFEDAVSSLYGPQNPTAINDSMTVLLATAADMRRQLQPATDSSSTDVSDQLQNLNISDVAPALPEKTSKWLQLCFAQIDQLSSKCLPVT
ncbi:hypothetical protein BKA62DRAFT_610700 [Auriculariales sp. MPI-PUGE-AT-0066]|nr:hypothetical protein BKA62DRAFT_610700 [Auriculariales sp. MPI-PUGE-AT-0066]